MLSKLIIPVIDTENSTFETDVKMSNEEFRYLQEQALIEKNDINKGIRNYRNTDEHISNTTKYNTFKSECLFLTPRKEEINEDFFINLLDRENAFLLLININPNDMHNNAEEEIKFWADDSDRILNDYTLDDRTRIKALPIKTLGIELNGEDYNLINCKLIENRSDRKFPFYYIILVEKISKN
jgi:hypothetical protein